jgi:chromatin remodeling complex protein RSC6
MSKSTSKKSVQREVSENMDENKKSVARKPPAPVKEEKKKPTKPEPVPEPVKEEKKAAPKPAKAEPVAKPAKASKKAEVKEVEPEEEEHEEEAAAPKRRREVNATSVEAEFDALLEMLKENIESSRSAGDKKRLGNVKLLRQLGKRLKVLKCDCMRLSKTRRQKRGQHNNSSGFMKPVRVSDAMAKFASWDPSQLRSRIDATKFICQYIKEHNLQNHADRRQINPDKKLVDLLGHDPAKESTPLTYYSIQQKIQKHFSNPQ